MNKHPESGERLICDIEGRWLPNGMYPPGDHLYVIESYYFANGIPSVAVRVPSGVPVQRFYIYLRDIEWLEEEQFWVIRTD